MERIKNSSANCIIRFNDPKAITKQLTEKIKNSSVNCITNFNDPKGNYQTINGVNNEFKKGENKKKFKISKKQKKKKKIVFF